VTEGLWPAAKKEYFGPLKNAAAKRAAADQQ